jgi:hypothetical protein
MLQSRYMQTKLKRNQSGKFYFKVFWLASIILSLLLTLLLNLIF